MTEINPLHTKQRTTYHTVWNVITTSCALVNLTVKKEYNIPSRMLHKICHCWVLSTGVMVPRACKEAGPTAGQHHCAASERVTERGGLWGCAPGIFFNMTYEWERAATGKEPPVLAGSNEREGSWRISGQRRGTGEEEEKVRRIKNTTKKPTTWASVPQPLNRAMVYDYLA